MKIIGFHNSDEEYGFLSNWYPTVFYIRGQRFTSMEQYMMYRKARLFQDLSAANLILQTNDVAEIKKQGRKVHGYDDLYWNGVRQLVVYEGLLEKFSQNADLKEELLNTGDAILAECAVKDRIWGIGLSMNDPNRLDITKWLGKNLLGYALMMARDHFNEE